jgi:hypothetical protein
MSSGKQLSFAFGEVSPSLRYRVDANFYAQGASKILNMTVKASGGVQNRGGFGHCVTPTYQDDLPYKRSKPGIRLFSFTNSSGERFIIELMGKLEGSPSGWDFVGDGPYAPQSPIKVYKVEYEGTARTGQLTLQSISFLVTYSSATLDELFDLERCYIAALGDSFILTVPTEQRYRVFTVKNNIGAGTPFVITTVFDMAVPALVGSPPSTSLGTLNGYGNIPADLRVSYIVTQELNDGSELVWQSENYDGNHPHPERQSYFNFDPEIADGVKQYNIYRSSGPYSHYYLVGRVNPGGNGVTFRDYLSTPDITVQPPLDFYIYPLSGFTRRVAYYKERTILVYSGYRAGYSIKNTKHEEGQVGVSKIGSPIFFGRPNTPNNIDAFTFTLPNNFSTKITNLMVLNRLILFTEKNAISIRGGDNGILLPLQVNPDVIYNTGCAEDVNPVAIGDRGYYVAPDKSCLVMIKISGDDSSQAGKVSVQSEHLFEAKDITQMAGTSGREDILWILKKDGKLISVTVSDDGIVMGFARHDTDGHIEAITTQSIEVPEDDADYFGGGVYRASKKTVFSETLFISVIRNGQRHIERLSIRDNDEEYLTLADSFYSWNLNNIKRQKVTQFNITAADFSAGENLTLTDVGGYSFFDSSYIGKKFDLFFERYNEETEKYYTTSVRLTVTAIAAPLTNILTATCEEDIPEELQNVLAKTGFSDIEKQDKMSWWAEAINQITGLGRMANKAVSVYADGQVISSPNNPLYQDSILTVSAGGVLTLPGYYSSGYVGLPYVAELETLDLETADARTFTDENKLINQVGVGIYKTRGGFVGQTGADVMEDMEQLDMRANEFVDENTKAKSGYVKVTFPSSWEPTGRVLFRQIDPLPMTILSVYPKGVAGGN